MSSLIFRADATPSIGTGHVMRCMALAQAAQDRGVVPVFVMTEESLLAEKLEAEQMEVARLDAGAGTLADARHTAQAARDHRAPWIVVDGYQFGTAYQQDLREAGFRTLCIDDFAHIDHYEADILLNQNLGIPEGAYTHKLPRASRVLLGPRYALLRREFTKIIGHNRAQRPVAERILVTLGGADTENATSVVLRAIDTLTDRRLSVRVILGAANPHRDALEHLAADSPHAVEFLHDVPDMPAHMQWADLAVGAAGSTVWELLAIGLPFVTGILAENQRGIAEALGHDRLALNIGWYSACSPELLAENIRRLVSSRTLREEFSARGMGLVDGKGAPRVLVEMGL